MTSRKKTRSHDFRVEMVNIGEAGRICLNQEIPGACQSCLWWEWDNHRRECANSHYHICPLYWEQLLSQGAQEQPRINGAQSGLPS
jgi:hypothetical protein